MDLVMECYDPRAKSLVDILLSASPALSAVVSGLGFADLRSAACSATSMRVAVRCNARIWSSNLLSPLYADEENDEDCLDSCGTTILKLSAMLQRIEVDFERVRRGIEIRHASRPLSSHAIAALQLQAIDEVGLLESNEAAVCPTPSASDAQAARRAREIARLPSSCCARFAPYLCRMADITPPTKKQIQSFVENGLCQAHSWYKHLPQNRGKPFWVFFVPEPRERQRTYLDMYEMLDWTSDGPPRTVVVDGQNIMTPPGVASGVDSLVYLSALCYDMSFSVQNRLAKSTRVSESQQGRLAWLQARANQCRLEHEEAVQAIERQCVVIWGHGWEVRRGVS